MSTKTNFEKTGEVEIKTFGFEIKEVSETGTIEGYASTFGNLDLGMDIVDKGAFKKTLNENGAKVPILADHRWEKQLGWNIDGFEDSKGLSVRGELEIADIPEAKARYRLAKKAQEIGARAGLSIGYITIKAEPDSKNPMIRRLKELKWLEYSFVTFPMNESAMVTAAKSFNCVDKARMLITHLREEGISLKDFEQALQIEAAAQNFDATKLGQSMENLLLKFKS